MTLDELEGEWSASREEPAVYLSADDPLSMNEDWLDAALDWDELESERVVTLTGYSDQFVSATRCGHK